MRRIEEQNPGLEFDWPRIIKGQGAPATEPRPPATNGDVRRPRPHDPPRPQQPRPDDKPPEPASREAVAIEREPAIAPPAIPPPAVVGAEVVIAAHDKLGAEGVQRLRHRYAEIIARVGERVGDPARREEVKAIVERLNPDAWTSAEEVLSALEQYESVLASVRDVVGRRRRRKKRGDRSADARTPDPDGQARAPDDGANAGEASDLNPGGEPDDSDTDGL